MKETLRGDFQGGGGRSVWALSLLSHLDAHLAWPSARQAHPLQPSFFPYPALPHSANARPPQLASSTCPTPTTPMERSTSLKGGGLGILHLQNPPPWTWATTVIFCRGGRGGGGTAFSLQRWEPWVTSQCPSPPLQIPPNHWQQPKKQFLQFPPTQRINKLLQL